MPGLIWVRDLVVGDVMVDGSVRGERLRPLVLSWVAVGVREPRGVRELAGWVVAIGKGGVVRAVGLVGIARSLIGSRAAGPSSRRVWKQRRASLRAIVSEARVCERPRAFRAW
jgi:hypothetical protein